MPIHAGGDHKFSVVAALRKSGGGATGVAQGSIVI